MNPNDKSGNTALVCGDGGCNKTESTNIAQDRIETDVVVHIETKLDLNLGKDSKKVIDDTPDIPVVIGYKGAKLDTTVDDHRGVFNANPIFVPSIYPGTVPSNTGNRRTFHNSAVGGSSENLSPNLYRKPSDSFYGYRPFNPSNNLYNSKVNVNIKTLPPVAVSLSTDEEIYPIHIKYKNNGTRISIPYFEPSFHSHYYGENPPPQHLWSPKSSNAINNVEFKTTRPTGFPSQLYRSNNHRHAFTNDGQNRCFCQGRTGNTGLSWYPSAGSSGITNPGSQINDKLAPFN